MSSILDLLARTTSPQDRMQQLLSLQSLTGARGSGGAPGSVDPNSVAGTTTTGTDVPSGPTQYGYTEYDRPYSGVPDLMTRFGISLQPGPMHSLLDIARASNIMPGAREVGMIDQGYRSYADQAIAGGTPQNPGGNNPNATTAGNSYHGQGLAIDAGQWSAIDALNRALAAAGWNQFDRSAEPWHYSYGVVG